MRIHSYLKKMIFYFSLLLLFLNGSTSIAFAAEPLLDEYDQLYNDLINSDNPGYKARSFSGTAYYNRRGNYVEDKEITSYINHAEYKIHYRWPVFLAVYEGNGFFKVHDTGNDIYYYTRNGEFHMDENTGYLVNRDGFKLVPEIKLNTAELIRSVHIEPCKGDITIDTVSLEDDPGTVFKYRVHLFKPAKNEIVAGDGLYFKFNGESVHANYCIGNLLELSTSDPYVILIRMKFILEQIRKNNIEFDNAETKLSILEAMLIKISIADFKDEGLLSLKGKNRKIIIETAPLLKRDYRIGEGSGVIK